MKVLVNGGLNLSTLDGWWAEAYEPEVGWAIGDGKGHDDDAARDAIEARQLYDILEREIIPKFHHRDAGGVPREWIAIKRESMARLTPEFSANRAVREYTEKYYLPAAAAYRKRAASQGALTRDLVNGASLSRSTGPSSSLVPSTSRPHGGFHQFRVQVFLGSLEPEAVHVELYANSQNGGHPLRQPMVVAEALVGAAGGFIFAAQVPSSRPIGDYTARIMPTHHDVSVPLEEMEILWQR